MAIMPHCVACGFDKGYQETRPVEFANHPPGAGEPVDEHGNGILGWSNELGVTAPPGVGLFCDRHYRRATQFRHLPSTDAIQILAAESKRTAMRRLALTMLKSRLTGYRW
jgi:hypothetical protein